MLEEEEAGVGGVGRAAGQDPGLEAAPGPGESQAGPSIWAGGAGLLSPHPTDDTLAVHGQSPRLLLETGPVGVSALGPLSPLF